jgi:periplasmic nitrate reductase NapE
LCGKLPARKHVSSARRGMHTEPVDPTLRRNERLLFILLAVVIWPFIAVGVVAGWGFIVWMYYLFTGPPGPA